MSTKLGQIPELVIDIAEASDSGTRVMLMRVCSGFFDLVMPLTWQKVKGAEKLFSLIEGAVVKIDPLLVSVDLPGVYSDTTLKRLQVYAPSVKSLEISGQRVCDYGLTNWEALLHHSESNPLLPNLARLTLTNQWWCYRTLKPQLPLLLMFISPSLLGYRIVYEMNQKAPITTNPRADTVLTALQRRCPNLNSLELYSGPGSCRYEEEMLVVHDCNMLEIFKAMPP
ncbi:hypothetical protein FRC08_013429 [Ceratobasidium sp. 394]|nr:hypothetical protein FRC08_013429 [Ceratobasidium sp. 394]